ncbi:MAG: hypothetical protein EAZ07_00835 [Cytophagales bacterium]|nr:MAG: hypothetical protein EAZ07_00835 [Cytophagales bacterium]
MKKVAILFIIPLFFIVGCKKSKENLPNPVVTQKSSKKYIEKISFKETVDFAQEIDTIENKIYLTFKEGIAIKELTPILSLSPSSTSSLIPNKPLDFSVPQIIEITAEDGTKKSFSIEAIQSKIIVIGIFYYDLNGDKIADDNEITRVDFSTGEFAYFNYRDDKSLNFYSGKLKVDRIIGDFIYMDRKKITSFDFNVNINNSVLNSAIIGDYKMTFPNIKFNFGVSYLDGGLSYPHTGGELSIKSYNKKFNTLSGSITNATFNTGVADELNPSMVKLISFSFENIPLK